MKLDESYKSLKSFFILLDGSCPSEVFHLVSRQANCDPVTEGGLGDVVRCAVDDEGRDAGDDRAEQRDVGQASEELADDVEAPPLVDAVDVLVPVVGQDDGQLGQEADGQGEHHHEVAQALGGLGVEGQGTTGEVHSKAEIHQAKRGAEGSSVQAVGQGNRCIDQNGTPWFGDLSIRGGLTEN